MLQVGAGKTAWMNRSNWYVHEVECEGSRAGNRDGVALPLHVYKSCVDEFEFVRGGEAVRGNPSNDFFWDLDLPDTDPRLHEGVPDFESATCGGRGSPQAGEDLVVLHELERRP